MSWTQVGAGVGSLTGIASLCWNIYLKLSSGPKLSIQAFAGMVKRPAPQDDPTFLKVVIRNTGTTQTTLTNYALYQYATKKRRFKKQFPEFSAVLNIYEGAVAPYKLGVGEEAMIAMRQNADFDQRLHNGRPLYFVVWHAFSEKGLEVPIAFQKLKAKDAQAGS